MATRAAKVDADLGFLLSQASFALTTELTAALSAIGVSPRSLCVLSKARGAEKTQGTLASESALDKTTMDLSEEEREVFLAALVRLAGGRLATPVECERPPRRRAPRAP